jgi:concanavalin A-like lectin/glucanase superfamily protein
MTMPRTIGTGRALLGRAAAAPSTLLNGLISYWKLDEASGVAIDSVGANTLTDNNTVTSAAGKVAGARQFTAAQSEWLSCADNAALSTGDIDFSIAVWINLNAGVTTRVVASKGNLGAYTTAEFSVEHSGGATITFYVGNGAASANVGKALAVSGWHFVVAWHDSVANTINIQVDNGTLASTSYSGGSYDSAFDFNIGKWANYAGGYFDGLIDELAIWKRLLTAAERTSLYNAGAGITHPFVGA